MGQEMPKFFTIFPMDFWSSFREKGAIPGLFFFIFVFSSNSKQQINIQ